MSKLSKDEWDRRVMPRDPKLPRRGTRFDTRLLDQLEGYSSQYRHWLNYAGDLPADYVAQQLHATRARLSEVAFTVAECLAR